jgi:hypothetical protein
MLKDEAVQGRTSDGWGVDGFALAYHSAIVAAQLVVESTTVHRHADPTAIALLSVVGHEAAQRVGARHMSGLVDDDGSFPGLAREMGGPDVAVVTDDNTALVDEGGSGGTGATGLINAAFVDRQRRGGKSEDRWGVHGSTRFRGMWRCRRVSAARPARNTCSARMER